jgi:hypothetical protein
MSGNSSPDWFARRTALVALGFTAFGLYLSYRSYTWQSQESLEERILVHLGFERAIENNKGEVDIEVVNLGMHPIYIKYVEVQPPNGCKIMGVKTDPEVSPDTCGLPIYDHNRLAPNEHLTPLEPGDMSNYAGKWDFSRFPLHDTVHSETALEKMLQEPDLLKKDIKELGVIRPDAPDQHLWVRVETTKKSFRQRPILSWAQITGDVPQEHRSPASSKK